MEFLQQHAIEIVGLVLGLFYLYYEYHASAKVWIFGLLMPLISMVVYFRAGLYADFSINIYYFLAAAYGLVKWRGLDNKGVGVPITRASARVMAGCVGVTAVIWFLIWLLLTRFTNSTVPVADAFTTALSIVAAWMMARKYLQQWWAWIVVDIVCVALYIYKDIPFYAVLYAVYTVVAVAGYRKWLRLMPPSQP